MRSKKSWVSDSSMKNMQKKERTDPSMRGKRNNETMPKQNNNNNKNVLWFLFIHLVLISFSFIQH